MFVTVAAVLMAKIGGSAIGDGGCSTHGGGIREVGVGEKERECGGGCFGGTLLQRHEVEAVLIRWW
jgi:hypothetical protein